MDLLHKIMDLVIPPISFVVLCITIPPYHLFKFFYSILRTFSMEDMAGKVVLVTGASSGIGEQLVYEYARRRACVVLVARRKKRLEQVAEKARALGSSDVLVVCGDVSKIEDCKRFIEEAVNHFGRLDHLVNNAGFANVCQFEDITNIPSFTSMMDVNFWGSIYATHFALPHLRKSKGRIVVVASSSGWLISPRLAIYAATKAALINFYDSLRVELDPTVTITIACPGVTDSEMTQGKYLGQDGVMQLDEETMSLLIGKFPVIGADVLAKRIVNGACRGERSITQPAYFGAVYLWKVFCPEIVHWFFLWIHAIKPMKKGDVIVTGRGKILDYTK